MSLKRIRQWWQKGYEQWLDRRLPPCSQVRLTLRNLFIFPSRFGWAFLALLSTVFILGTNYQNNLVLALLYLLISLFMTSLFHCFINLHGLKIEALKAENIFLGGSVRFDLVLKNSEPPRSAWYFLVANSANKQRFSICLDAQNGIAQHCDVIDRDARLGLEFTPKSRGYFKVKRLRIYSRYPLGLYTCWSLLAMRHKVLVYPKPIVAPIILSLGDEQTKAEAEARMSHGSQEFIGIRPYREGEALNKIAWKQVAQGRGFVSKDFSQLEQSRTWLRLADTHGATLEIRLGKLCYQVLELNRSGLAFGLDLGVMKIEVSQGKEHQNACLRALALYGS